MNNALYRYIESAIADDRKPPHIINLHGTLGIALPLDLFLGAGSM